MYNTDSNIIFKTTMLNSSSCDYLGAYILVKGGITITGAGDDVAGETNKDVIFKNWASFIIIKQK